MPIPTSSIRLSKFLSLILRHDPARVGITLDDAGWTDVDTLLDACARHGSPLTRAQLDDLVASSDKQRFALSPDGARIRANQGHSVDFPTPPAPGPGAGGPGGERARGGRSHIAKTTVAACDAGSYHNPHGAPISIAAELAHAKAGTVLHALDDRFVPAVRGRHATRLTVTDETTTAAIIRLAAPSAGGGELAVLNFASAKNPGGGFLGGAQAQEEALARASGLYPCLLTQPTHYARNRANDSALYLDLAIYSPHVPFFRDDDGGWLDAPALASVITCAAPNAGALRQHGTYDAAVVEATLRRRALLVLQVAAHHGAGRLVLGAWGAGVFGNDPVMVAAAFQAGLTGPFAGVFAEIVFAIPGAGRPNHDAFVATFG